MYIIIGLVGFICGALLVIAIIDFVSKNKNEENEDC